jgi:hypothetical protein
MNSVSIALMSVLGTILIGVTVAGSAYVLQKRSKAQAAFIEALTRHTESLDKYSTATSLAADPLKNVPKLVEALVVQTNIMRTEIKALREMLFKKNEMRAYEVPSDEEKDYAWRIKELVSSGMSHEDALKAVINDSLSTVNPGVFSLD